MGAYSKLSRWRHLSQNEAFAEEKTLLLGLKASCAHTNLSGMGQVSNLKILESVAAAASHATLQAPTHFGDRRGSHHS